MIFITFPNGRSLKYNEEEFDDFGIEIEHKYENLILNKNNPFSSLIYEIDSRGEIINKEYISYIII